jgi:RHS repeat-associated protein
LTSKDITTTGGTGTPPPAEHDVLTYDLQNRLTSDSVKIGAAAATVTTYGYDTDGNRVSKTDATGTIGYTIDDTNPTGYAQVIEEWDGTTGSQPGDPSFDHPDVTYLLGSTVLGQSDGTKHNSFFQTDGHGSTRAILDATGQVATGQIFAYDAYGNRIQDPAHPIIPATTILYTGQQFDTGLGMYDLRARFYDPRNGRFSSFDSQQNSIADPQSMHKYLYANANPVMFGDPTGHEASATEVLTTNTIGARMMSLLLPGLRAANAARMLLVESTGLYTSAAMLLVRGFTYFTALYSSYMTFRATANTAVSMIEQAVDDAIMNDVMFHALHHRVFSQTEFKALDNLAQQNLGRHIYMHYSFVKDAASFANGLWKNPIFAPPGGPVPLRSYGTQDVYATGWQAHSSLALPSREIQDAEYIVMPKKGCEPIGPSVVAPGGDAAGRSLPGLGNEFIFWNGSGGAGTVFGPVPIPLGLPN